MPSLWQLLLSVGHPYGLRGCLAEWDDTMGPRSWRGRWTVGDGACPGVPLASTVLIHGGVDKGK